MATLSNKLLGAIENGRRESINLIRESAEKFASANVSWSKARIGIMGFWVGCQTAESESDPLLRAKKSEALWVGEFQGHENPYGSVVRFLEANGRFIRWEHNILDIVCPDGNKYGLTEKSFAKV